MSKNEKRNSETNSLESDKLNNSVDRFSTSTETRTETSAPLPTDKTVQKSAQKTELSGNHSEDEKIPKQLFRLPPIVPVLFRSTVNLFHWTVKGVCQYGSFGYALGKKAIALLCRSAAFFVPKKTVSDEESEGVDNKEIGKESSKNIPQPATPLSNQPAIKTVADGNSAVTGNRIDNKVNNERNKTNEYINDNDNDIEDDEEKEFRWVNLGFKVTAAAVVVLLLTGGYWGVKMFLGKNKPSVEETEIVQLENTKLSQQQQDNAAKNDDSKTTAPTSVKSAQQSTVASTKEPVAKKTPEETVKKPNEKTTTRPIDKPTEKPEKLAENRKVEIPVKENSVATLFEKQEKTVLEPEKDVTVRNNETNNIPTVPNVWDNSQPATTVTDFSNPLVSPTVASPSPAVTTNYSDPPELPVSLAAPIPTEQSIEKPALVQNSLTLPNSPTTPTEPQPSVTTNSVTTNFMPLEKLNTENPITTNPAATPPPTTPTATATVPTLTSTPPVSVINETVKITPLKMQSPAADSVSPLNSSISQISGDQSLTIPKSEGEIQTLSSLSTFSQPVSEPSLSIPEQPKADSFSGGFGKAPTPPEMNTPIPSPAVEPVIPIVATKKEETIPAIPKSGTIQPIAEAVDFALTPSSPPEPSPAIPTDSVTFAQPTAAPPAVPQPSFATPTPYVPPIFGQSAASTPSIPNTATNTSFSKTETATEKAMNTEAVTKTNNEPMLEIPKDAQHSATMAAPTMTVPAAEAATPAITVPAILPQHVELAKAEPPLGSQLQNQVREIRNQEFSESRLRFGSDASAPTRAVRYHPQSAVKDVTELVPSQPMPVDVSDSNSNPLIGLLPTGNPQPGAADSLPPLETAPPPITATPNPAYRRSLNRDLPASLQQPESLQSESLQSETLQSETLQSKTLPSTVNNSEQRARRFQRLNADIKQSPTTTEQYTVQENDTYMTISDKFFKTSRLFRVLAEHNRQKYGTDYKLSAGTVIEIPPADYLKSNYAEMLTRSGQRPEKKTTDSVPVQGIRYTIQADDTVFRIATNQLRDSSRWQEIIEMNSDKLRSPRDLQPGMEIILPATTATQTTYGRR
ncbi:MAG: LysM peptidoglycan-binding domain-containing protein [Planctomycetaceae bacterium]|jgi:nucleoid-associated protein YgaU|nr:LysM peptidoglycan-binding domain-containing protein [Planctomycetaceae bacterium]